MRIAIVGSGSWGTALAQTLAHAGGDRHVVLCPRSQEVAESITETRHNPRYLTEISLDAGIEVTAHLSAALRGARVVILAVPTGAMRSVAESLEVHLPPDAVVVSAAKGFERSSGARMSTVLDGVIGAAAARVTALSGPNIAVEIALGLPAAGVVAGEPSCAGLVRDMFMGSRYRAYSTDDLVGVEYAGALKNIIAIAAGVVESLGLGHNAMAALITRGLAEMSRLATAMGGCAETLAGLSGLGDLVLTCTGELSRNRRVGIELGRGRPLPEILAGMKMVAEGVRTTRVALALGACHGIELPITAQMAEVLDGRKSPRDAVEDLMLRPPRAETDVTEPVS